MGAILRGDGRLARARVEDAAGTPPSCYSSEGVRASAAAGARRWDQSFGQTVDRVFREMRSERWRGPGRPALSWLVEYASRAPVRAGRADDSRMAADSPGGDGRRNPPGSSEPSAEPRASFAPSSSSGFFGDMGGDGEELGGLSDDEDDDGSLEDEMSNLRVEEDLDIEELMRDETLRRPNLEPTVTTTVTTTTRFAAMPRRERSAVLAAAVYGAFNSDDYRKKRDIYSQPASYHELPPAAFIDSVMDAATLAAQGDETRPPRRS